MAADVIADLRVSIANEDDIVLARQRVRFFARDLGFSILDQSRIATAVSELTRNVVRYATNSQGEMTARAIRDRNGRTGVEIVVCDEGPGIADVAMALSDGYSTGHGMGLGLSGTKRLMDEMKVDSALGQGTTVVVRKWRR